MQYMVLYYILHTTYTYGITYNIYLRTKYYLANTARVTFCSRSRKKKLPYNGIESKYSNYLCSKT